MPRISFKISSYKRPPKAQSNKKVARKRDTAINKEEGETTKRKCTLRTKMQSIENKPLMKKSIQEKISSRLETKIILIIFLITLIRRSMIIS